MPQDPLAIVQGAVEALRDRGSHLLASADSLARLASTTTAAAPDQQSQPEPARAARKFTEKVADFAPTRSADHTAKAAPVISKAGVATETGTKAERLAAMRGPVLACAKCPYLAASRTQVVFGVGNPEAEVMFVGEAPGADEDLAGEPFVGRAGQLLTKMIETMGFHRREVYIANVLKCRPHMPPGESGNRKPTGAEMETCKPYLLDQIGIIQPRIIVALGATALEGLLGEQKLGITKARGTWREFHGVPLMPTFHPSYLLHNQSLVEKRKVWEDMLAVLERMGRPITAKQRAYFLPR